MWPEGRHGAHCLLGDGAAAVVADVWFPVLGCIPPQVMQTCARGQAWLEHRWKL